MGDFRIRYGAAFGPEGTLAVTSGLNVFPPGDTTPDVTIGAYWISQNTSATVITYFDTNRAGIPSMEEGKVLIIRFADGGSTLVSSTGQIVLSSTGGGFLTGEILALIHSNSAWYELFRSENSVGRFGLTTNVGGTIAPNVDGRTFLLIQQTAAATLVSFSGGEVGQRLVVMPNSSGAITITTGGNIALANTSDLVMNASGAYEFVKRANNRWTILGPALP